MSGKQKGFVSIISVIMLSILVILITVAFVKVMQRGQRQILDSQLSTQAYYAAETGINDAMQAILNNPSEIPVSEDTDCTPTRLVQGVPSSMPVQTITVPDAPDAQVSYTCQLITSGTKDILVDGKDGVAKVFPVYTDSSASTIDIEWEDDKNHTNFNVGGAETYGPANSYPGNAPAMLRITVYQTAGGNISSQDLINGQKNFFVKPGVSTADGEVSMADPDATAILAKCEATSPTRLYACRVSITGIANTNVQNAVFVKVQPIYKDANYRVTANNVSAFSYEDTLALFGAQYRIDVTGKANDVYRRLEVRTPLQSFTYPSFGVDSDSICKKFEWSGSSVIYSACPGY
jgi:Tfp pilus assembly protein PilX